MMITVTESFSISTKIETARKTLGRGKLNYLFPQVTLAISLKVVVRPYFDKNQQKN